MQQQNHTFYEEIQSKNQLMLVLEQQLYEKSQLYEKELRKREQDRLNAQQINDSQKEKDRKELIYKDGLVNEIEAKQLAIQKSETLCSQLKE